MQKSHFETNGQACTLVELHCRFTTSLFALEVECNLDQKDPTFQFKFIVNANFRILTFAFPESQSQLENLGKIFDFFIEDYIITNKK